MKKAQISTQVIFFIMMAIIFAWILIFGFQQLFFVQETLSETELLDLKAELEETLSFCEDPLNRGNFRTFTSDHSSFNAVCILGNSESTGSSQLDSALSPFFETGDNVVLLKIEGSKPTSGSFVVNSASPVDSFSVFYSRDTQCYFDEDFNGELEVRVTC